MTATTTTRRLPTARRCGTGGSPADPPTALMAYTESLPFDQRLWPDDIAGSRAHVRGLATGRSARPRRTRRDPRRARRRSRPRWQSARSSSSTSDEDIHTAIERRVTELAGPAGGKLHTGRSRNDQVGHRSAAVVQAASCSTVARRDRSPCSRCSCDRAVEAGGIYLPGYTHLQRAQPVLLAHHLLAHGWALGARRRSPARHVAPPRRVAARRRRAGRVVVAASIRWAPRPISGSPALRQQPRRGRRSRPRRRSVVRPDADRHPPVPDRRGVGAVDIGGVRLRHARRRLRHRLVDAAAEEEPRHRRTRPRQERAAHRRPDRTAGHAEGAAAGVQPRPPGGQGAAVRLGRSGDAGARRR